MKNTTSTSLSVNSTSLPAPTSGLESYIQQVNAVPLLTQEEEFSLAQKLQAEGDLQAAQRLVLSHLRYVLRIAKGYLGYGLPLSDLVQEGTVGLMKAVKRFDPNVRVRLVSFAVHWIKAEIHEYILKNWRIVKVATTKAQRKLFFNLRKAKKRLGWSTHEEVQALAKDLGVSPVEVRRMEERLNARDLSFDLPTEEDHNQSHTLVPAEYLEDTAANPALQLEAGNWDTYTGGNLKVAFQALDPRSQDILKKRFLLEDNSGEANKATLQDLASDYNVSPERIRQLEKNALLKLKAALEQAVA